MKDAAQVALEAGNSVGIIFGHYRELVHPEDADRWFSIVPGDKPPNVLSLSGANSATGS